MKRSHIIHGLTEKELRELEDIYGSSFLAIDKSLIRDLFRQRPSDGHKGTFGHTLIIAGNEGSYGAGILASMAALRTGCGLVTTSIPAGGITPLLSHLPEGMTRVRRAASDVRDLDLSTYDAIAIGPGIGISADSTEILSYLLNNYKGSLVIDADALTILSQNQHMYELLNGNVILTPHPGEFSRLCVNVRDRKDSINAQMNFQKKFKCILIVKGKNSTVATDKGFFYNTTGNSGMATAGSGDVLTGIIASLCAQDYTTSDAALIGTYMHGFSGDAAVKNTSMSSLIASDIIGSLHQFFRKFETID